MTHNMNQGLGTWPHDDILHAWWVLPGRLLAGEYPGSLDPALAAGRVVYVHCWGGKGRTGTVIGCWLIDHESLGYPEVLQRMQELRRGSRKAGHRVPDTDEQSEVLRRRATRQEGRG